MHTGLAIVAIRVIVAWLAPGLTMLLLTGIQGIPPEFYEPAGAEGGPFGGCPAGHNDSHA